MRRADYLLLVALSLPWGCAFLFFKLLAGELQRHGGSISAEHGIGLVKKPYLASTRDEAEIALMRGIRRVLDPDGLMNPGKLFDP